MSESPMSESPVSESPVSESPVNESPENESKANGSSKDKPMALRDHLSELRKRIIRIFLFFIGGFIIGFYGASVIVGKLTDMGAVYGYKFVYIAPQELLMVYFSVAFIAGLIFAVPEAAREIYEFAKPGLYDREQSAFKFTLIFGTACFVTGVVFAYKICVPFMLYFLIHFNTSSVITASISIQEYISFLLTVFMVFGLVFELPVVVVVFTILGILKPEYLVKFRKPMIVLIFFLAAIITPPDAVSQVMVAIPVCLLYELSIVLSRVFYKRKALPDMTADAK